MACTWRPVARRFDQCWCSDPCMPGSTPARAALGRSRWPCTTRYARRPGGGRSPNEPSRTGQRRARASAAAGNAAGGGARPAGAADPAGPLHPARCAGGDPRGVRGPARPATVPIRRQNLDILDIPVAEITRQYVDYIGVMQDLRFELAAEYLVMAAILAEIKSRMLLPRTASEEVDE